MCSLDEDLDLIFSRFGKILSCEVIRDKKTGDSLQYAFIEFEEQKSCEQAYFKMQDVLIDDHRIHVDFSQSVRYSGSDPRWSVADIFLLGLKVIRLLANGNQFQARSWTRRVWWNC